MAHETTTPPENFRIEVSADRLSVTVHSDAGVTVKATQVLERLRALKVQGIDDGVLFEQFDGQAAAARSVVVAEGVAPVDDAGDRMAYKVPLNEIPSLGITRVEAGQVIGTLVPGAAGGAAGRDGRDVFGSPLPRTAAARAVRLGKNLVDTRGDVTAAARGFLRLTGDLLSIEPLLEIHSDDGAAVTFDGDVTVRGGLSAGQVVRVGGSLIVGGAVDGADLQAGGSVHVKGGVVGKSVGLCVVGGDLWCRFVNAMPVVAGGSVFVTSEVVQSRITCGGKLVLSRGPLVGGEAFANGGVACHVLGNERGLATLVEAGGDGSRAILVEAMNAEVERLRAKVGDIRQKIEPLLKHLKVLTPAQREKATELLYEASEMEEQAGTLAAAMDKKTDALRQAARAEVAVTERAYPGVVVRFSGVETVLSAAIKGPFKMVPRTTNGVLQIVLIDAANPGGVLLTCHRVKDARQNRAA